MQKSLMYGLLAVSLTWAAAQVWAQAAPAAGQPAAQAGPALAPGTVIGAQLSKGIDAKKAKVGQEVLAKSMADLRDTNGNVVIPRGARLLGHITQVKAATKQEPQSTLGIIFDKVEAKHGKESQEIGMHAAIQALEKPPSAPLMEERAPGMGGPGGASGGTGPGMGPGAAGGRTMGAPPPGQTGGMGGEETGGAQDQQGPAAPAINANSHGVIGIPNLSLSPQPSPTEGSVITSARGNVKLDGGTLLILRVMGQ